jgi:hypothetical protein
MLRDIEDQAALLDLRPSMAIRSGSGGGSLASHRAPANLDVIVANDSRRGTGRIGYEDADPWGLDDTASVLDVLHSWARIVREERELSQPAHVTVSGERDCLTRNIDWLAEQPFIDETYNDVRSLLWQLQRTNKTQDERPAGTCFLLNDTGVCGGRIWRKEEAREVWSIAADRCTLRPIKVSDGPAYCERCNTEWNGKDLDRLNIILEQQAAEKAREDARPRTEDGERMLTAPEMADLLGIKLTAFRMRASRIGARAVLGHYDPRPFQEQMTA